MLRFLWILLSPLHGKSQQAHSKPSSIPIAIFCIRHFISLKRAKNLLLFETLRNLLIASLLLLLIHNFFSFGSIALDAIRKSTR